VTISCSRFTENRRTKQIWSSRCTRADCTHFYDPRNKHFAFVITVKENKQGFTFRQVKGAEVAHTLYATLSYPSMENFNWVIRSNQIQNCPVTAVQDVAVATKIGGKNITALKGKTTQSKSLPVARDFLKVPTALINLHKEIFLKRIIFFS
jgi:hypothetical protein